MPLVGVALPPRSVQLSDSARMSNLYWALNLSFSTPCLKEFYTNFLEQVASSIILDTGVFWFDHRFSQIFTENVEIDQEKFVKSVKSVVEVAYFSANPFLPDSSIIGAESEI